MKYICTIDDEGKEEIFPFTRSINHDAMMEMLPFIKDKTWGNWKRVHRCSVSAGFINCEMECYGRSETLNLDSRYEEDTALLKSQLGIKS